MLVVQWSFSVIFPPSRWRVYAQPLEMSSAFPVVSSCWRNRGAGREAGSVGEKAQGSLKKSLLHWPWCTYSSGQYSVAHSDVVMGSINYGLDDNWAAVTICRGGSFFSLEKLNRWLFCLEDGYHKRMLLPFIFLIGLIQSQLPNVTVASTKHFQF